MATIKDSSLVLYRARELLEELPVEHSRKALSPKARAQPVSRFVYKFIIKIRVRWSSENSLTLYDNYH